MSSSESTLACYIGDKGSWGQYQCFTPTQSARRSAGNAREQGQTSRTSRWHYRVRQKEGQRDRLLHLLVLGHCLPVFVHRVRVACPLYSSVADDVQAVFARVPLQVHSPAVAAAPSWLFLPSLRESPTTSGCALPSDSPSADNVAYIRQFGRGRRDGGCVGVGLSPSIGALAQSVESLVTHPVI